MLNNPLMCNDPSGEFFAFLGLGVLFWKAVIIGAAVGLASYTIGLAVTGNLDQWNLGGALKSMLFGAAGGAVSFGVGSIFSTSTGTLSSIGTSIQNTLGGVGLSVIQAGTHAISQGVLGLMQGQDFLSSAVGGFAGSLGASGFGAVAGDWAGKAGGQIFFGALSGGIGAELSGGNFWQGAVTCGIVAGLNHVLHDTNLPDNGYDEDGKKINNLGGDEIDYILRKNPFGEGYQILDEIKVKHIYGSYGNGESYGYRLHHKLPSPALYDPSFSIISTYVGGAITVKGIGNYLTRTTGGIKQWIRTGNSYSHAGKFKTYSTRWGAGGNHWKKIGNPTLQNLNRAFRKTKLPGNSWRTKDPGHFHWKKIK
ncbi:phage tail tape measure protein [Riemerella columbina]|uniref:phage tail tape measure protein n=1 Tax=Riemerella columbina TaxID=103810 RepID=UPI00266EB524|nr:hypothetical protein [Riemerella columbina]WKS95307.1 hypothetical protein NYR17_00785 [Riemerella columbina]